MTSEIGSQTITINIAKYPLEPLFVFKKTVYKIKSGQHLSFDMVAIDFGVQ